MRSIVFPGPVAGAPAEAARARTRGKLPMLPLLVLVTFGGLGALADFAAPHPPNAISLRSRLLPPFWQDRGSLAHPLGTDRLGRDIASRIIHGARVSIAAGLAAVAVGGVIGALLGLVSGYYGRWTDTLIMRATDAMLSLPIILIALLFAVVFGPSFGNLVLVLGLVLWARFARLVRGETLAWKEREFVALARVAGCSSFRILRRHILPNIVNPLVVLATLQVGWVIIVEASLSFLGAGIPPPTPSWGAMIADGRSHVTTAWWLSFFPGLALVLVVLSINLLGDWLRDYLDPRTRNLT